MNERRGGRTRLIRWISFVAANLVLMGVLAAGAFLYGWARFARALPELQGWHRQAPAAEFRAAQARPGYTFEDYLKQEAEVFQQLDALVAGPWRAEAVGEFDRFRSGSVCNPEKTLERNWNRSFVLEAGKPIGGVLLVHGLSDSPYSLRALAERLQTEGYTVVGLRVPGHGTCPRALAEATREDWTAAVKIAVAGVRKRIPAGTPLILAGYSNGGALSVHYAALALEDKSLPAVSAVVLFSPMIGISPLARVSHLYRAVARLCGEEKALWSDVSPEVDPFKYCSWPMNASEQAWTLTQELERRLAAIDRSGRMGQMPPILAMQSAIDATVVVPKLITVLFDRLQPGGASELVLFDVNRVERLGNLMDLSFEREIRPRLQRKRSAVQADARRERGPRFAGGQGADARRRFVDRDGVERGLAERRLFVVPHCGAHPADGSRLRDGGGHREVRPAARLADRCGARRGR